jgi:carbon starvation protein CstA
MNNFSLDSLIDLFKRMVLWFIITVIFTTKELREEALSHFYSGVIRIPGVCYGSNIIKGYQAIGQVFPDRCWLVRLDYLWGYLKMLLLMACVCGILILMAQTFT